MRWILGVLVALVFGAMPHGAAAQAACKGVIEGETLPDACCGAMPADGRDPYVPAALMHRDAVGNLVTLRTCFMTARFVPPAGVVLNVLGQWGFFAPDATTRVGRLVAEGGQSTDSGRGLPGPAALGILSVPIESDSDHLPPGALALVQPDVLVVVTFDGSSAGDWTRRAWQSASAIVPAGAF